MSLLVNLLAGVVDSNVGFPTEPSYWARLKKKVFLNMITSSYKARSVVMRI